MEDVSVSIGLSADSIFASQRRGREMFDQLEAAIPAIKDPDDRARILRIVNQETLAESRALASDELLHLEGTAHSVRKAVETVTAELLKLVELFENLNGKKK